MEVVYSSASLEGLEVLSCDGDRHFKTHLHDDAYVLWLNSEAPEHFDVNGHSGILQPGSVCIFEPGAIHDNGPCDPSRRHLRSFYFTKDFLDRVRAEVLGKTSIVDLKTSVVRNPRLWRRFANLHEEFMAAKAGTKMDDLLFDAFARLFHRYDKSIQLPDQRGKDHRVGKAVEIFESNLDNQISIDSVAESMKCTSFHLMRLFRQQKGMTPYAFLTQLRLERARHLIEDGVNFTDAALESGLCDQSHLTRKFKARYGLTPGQYRKQRNLT